MKKIFITLWLLLTVCIPAFAEYMSIPEIFYNTNERDIEISPKIRDFDNYEPIPKNLQNEYVKKIPENLIENFQLDMNKGLKHILYDKITYNHKTLKQMLLEFNKKSDSIYQEYLSNHKNNEKNKIFIEQLKEMNGTISLYPNTIIEQIHPYIEKYDLGLEPGAESDIFLYKYYIEKYQIKYSKEIKEFLKLKEYVFTKINIYILKISNKI